MAIKRKYKQDRKLLQNTFGTSKSPFNKRKYKPGIHQSVRLYTTFYGKLLVQKQKLKAFYKNMKDYQLFTIIKKYLNQPNYQELIIKKLETRLDSVLFRSGLVKSFGLARQLINHRKVKVNGVYATSPSFSVKNAQKVTFTETGQKIIKESLNETSRKLPNYIFVDLENLTITLNEDNLPKNDQEVFYANKISLDDVIKSYKL